MLASLGDRGPDSAGFAVYAPPIGDAVKLTLRVTWPNGLAISRSSCAPPTRRPTRKATRRPRPGAAMSRRRSTGAHRRPRDAGLPGNLRRQGDAVLMTGRHPIARRLWPAVWLCLGVAAQAQPAPPVDAAQAAAAHGARHCRHGAGAGNRAGAGKADMNLGGAVPGRRPMPERPAGSGDAIEPGRCRRHAGSCHAGAAMPPGPDQAGHARSRPVTPPHPTCKG